MSTDIYGIRVLDVDRERLSVRLRVFAVYYDTVNQWSAPLPEDPAFFLCVLWEFAQWHHGRIAGADSAEGPLAKVLDVDTLLYDDGPVDDHGPRNRWLAVNTRWFVADVRREAVRNRPESQADWDGLADFYYLRSGGWKDEDLLVQADYSVRVTDARWLSGLTPAASWSTAWLPSPHIGMIRPADAPFVTDFADPMVVIASGADPAEEGGHNHVERLAFSDDGAYLAVLGYNRNVAVYATADWSLRANATADHLEFHPVLMWIPGEHVITLHDEADQQWAYDVAAGAEVQVAPQIGDVRSRTGRHRATGDLTDGALLLTAPGGPVRIVGGVEGIAFSHDESRMFLACDDLLRVADPVTGKVLATVPTGVDTMSGFAVSPSGEYFALTGTDGYHPQSGGPLSASVHRAADGAIVVCGANGLETGAIAWSPDGELIAVGVDVRDGEGVAACEIRVFRIGLPAQPPAGLFDAAAPDKHPPIGSQSY